MRTPPGWRCSGPAQALRRSRRCRRTTDPHGARVEPRCRAPARVLRAGEHGRRRPRAAGRQRARGGSGRRHRHADHQRARAGGRRAVARARPAHQRRGFECARPQGARQKTQSRAATASWSMRATSPGRNAATCCRSSKRGAGRLGAADRARRDTGRAGTRPLERAEITLFESHGMGVQDLYAAYLGRASGARGRCVRRRRRWLATSRVWRAARRASSRRPVAIPCSMMDIRGDEVRDPVRHGRARVGLRRDVVREGTRAWIRPSSDATPARPIPGPSISATGTTAFPLDAIRRDLRLLLKGARRLDIPLLIGSAGTAGGDIQVALMQRMVEEIARRGAAGVPAGGDPRRAGASHLQAATAARAASGRCILRRRSTPTSSVAARTSSA